MSCDSDSLYFSFLFGVTKGTGSFAARREVCLSRDSDITHNTFLVLIRYREHDSFICVHDSFREQDLLWPQGESRDSDIMKNHTFCRLIFFLFM